ncbi:MAG: sigma 54-interacting transcriptional regulator [Deltaproteobacteria bacterium]|nr:sigma 54-interacting transcriptional regulator [Deltaproteobacteria bacterium]
MATCHGRERELAFILSRLEATSAHGTGLVAVGGPAGIGKSTLLTEVRERARLGGFAVLEGYCVPHAAFAPWSAIAGQALAFLRAKQEQEQLPPGDLEALAPLISGRPPREKDEDDEGALRFAEAVARLLAAVGRVRPVLVLLRAFQHIDDSSQVLLRTLLDTAGPVGEPTPGAPAALVLVAHRPGHQRDLADHPRVATVNLEGLDLDGVRKLATQEQFLTRLHAITGGSPDAILSLLDRASLPRAAESQSRISPLGEQQKLLLAALSLAGRPLPMQVLAAALSVDSSAGTRLLPALVDAKLLWRDLDTTVGDVVVGLELADDGLAAIHTLDADRIAKLEHGLGEALQDWGRVSPEESLAHLLRGERPSAFVSRAVEIAKQLLLRHAPASALQLISSSAAHASREELQLLAPIAVETARAAGRPSDAQRVVEMARNAAPENATLAKLEAELSLAVGALDACEAALKQARLLDDASVPTLRGQIDAIAAEHAFQRGALGAAEQFAQAAIDHTPDTSSVHVQARNTLTKVYLWRGDLDRAWDWTQEHIATARERNATTEILRGIINLGVIAVRRGDLDDAARHFETARSLSSRGGSMMIRGVLRENQAVLAHLRGHFGEALTLYQEALGILIRVGHRQFLARVANNLGELYVQVGESARARRMCDYAAQVGRGFARGLVAEGLLLRGQIELYDGHHDQARSALHEALAMFAQTGEKARAAEAHVLLARVALAEGELTRARAALEHIDEDVDATGVRVASERLKITAELKRAEGLDGTEQARAALVLAERAGDTDLRLRIHVLTGKSLLDRGDIAGARVQMDAAIALREQLLSRVGEALRDTYESSLERAGLSKLRAQIEQTHERLTPQLSSDQPRPARVSITDDLLGGLIGSGAAMSALRRLILRIGPADTTVLLRGETGTGKERVAEAIHRSSRRRNGPLIKVNCAAIGEGVLLSELFGHEKGAYTGAVGRRKGRFEAADGGTIFLDEIGDISLAMQTALLRVLQEHTFERVGGNTPIRVDVRVIAATNKNLEQAMRTGQFRDDLYYRLADITVKLPPLRDRLEDIPQLAAHFLMMEAAAGQLEPKPLSPAALRRLSEHAWPGNVRELSSKLRNALVMSEGDMIEELDLDLPTPEAKSWDRDNGPVAGTERNEIELVYERIRDGGIPLFEMRKELERGCIERALHEAKGNITRAAALLGMKRPRLSQLVREHGLAKGTEAGDTSES